MFNARVTAILQDEHGLTVRYTDTTTRAERNAHADWLVCTIPLSILSEIDMAVLSRCKHAAFKRLLRRTLLPIALSDP